VHALFLIKRPIHGAGGPADVQPARRHLEIVRDRDVDARRIDMNRGGTIHGFAQRLEANPAAAVARKRKTDEAEIKIVLNRRGIEERHHCRLEDLLALVRGGRGLSAVVVAGNGEHTAMRGRARQVCMAEHVDGAIDARALAVPDAEHSIDRCTGKEPHLLRAPHGSCSKILVKARLEADVVLLEELCGLPERGVVTAERRAAIAGNEARGGQPGGPVTLTLHHGKPDQRLDAREINAARLEGVLVLQCYGNELHLALRIDAPLLRAPLF